MGSSSEKPIKHSIQEKQPKKPVIQENCMTEKGFDRVVFFSDAVTAFALTLLITPLTDIIANEDVVGGVANIQTILSENSIAVLAFIISFFVIISLWHAHHKMFDGVKTIDSNISRINSFWLFSIVCLPFATQAISGTFVKSNMIFYISMLLINNICLLLMHRNIIKNAIVFKADDSEFSSDNRRWSTIIILIIIGIIVLISPAKYGQFALILLLFRGDLINLIQEKLIKKFRRH